MRISNVHRRTYPVESSVLARFLDGLGSPDDPLWPRDRWPPIVLPDGVTCGSAGHHGPIHYVVERHEPGRLVEFRFRRPQGWDGTHAFVIEVGRDGRAQMSHILEMHTRGFGLVQWLLVFRPLHDALVEAALDRPARALQAPLEAPPWTVRVRLLRWLIRRTTQLKVFLRP